VFNVTALARTNVLAVTIERAGIAKVYQLTTRTDNPLGLKMLNLDSQEHPVVGHVEPGRPAAAAGLKADDKFVTFAGITIASREQLMDLINKRAGQPSEVVVERQGQRLTVNLTPIMDTQMKRGRIGIRFAETPLQYRLQKPGPLPWDSIAEVWNRTVATVNAIAHSKQTGVSAGDLSGPVGILAMLASQVNTDYRLALNFMVLLNVSLAILNLLPLPVLDGGHILISIVEAIRRRPMSIKVLEYTTTAFAVLLISFMLYVSFNDIKRWDMFASLFKRPTQIETTTPAPATAPTQP
jgi:regulator of sigma E protease